MTSFGSPMVDNTILNLRLIPPLNAPTLPSLRCHSLTLFNLSSPVIRASSLPTPRMAAYNPIYPSTPSHRITGQTKSNTTNVGNKKGQKDSRGGGRLHVPGALTHQTKYHAEDTIPPLCLHSPTNSIYHPQAHPPSSQA